VFDAHLDVQQLVEERVEDLELVSASFRHQKLLVLLRDGSRAQQAGLEDHLLRLEHLQADVEASDAEAGDLKGSCKVYIYAFQKNLFQPSTQAHHKDK